MGEAREHHMLEPVRLLGKCRVQFRMRMSMGAGPPRGHEVENLPAVGVEQRRGFGPRDDDGLAFRPMLGEGMPDMAQVAREHLLGLPKCRARGDLRIVVHAAFRASLARSSSGSIAMSVAGVSGSSQGISAMTSTLP